MTGVVVLEMNTIGGSGIIYVLTMMLWAGESHHVVRHGIFRAQRLLAMINSNEPDLE